MLDVAVPPESVQWASERLAGAGRAEPRRDALRMWSDLTTVADRDTAYRAAVNRLAAGEPYAYVVGWAGFRYLTLAVDARVLIPRPETEGLVDGVLQRTSTGVAIDVGTGSGCLALSLAQEGTYRAVIGVDVSGEVLQVAAANRRATGLSVRLMVGSLVEAFGEGIADVLVANPPYLTLQEFEALDDSVRAWEPRLALVAGSDGLAAIGAILDRGARVLRPGGLLGLEVDCRRAALVAARARAAGWEGVEVVRDVFGRDRYVFARKRGSS